MKRIAGGDLGPSEVQASSSGGGIRWEFSRSKNKRRGEKRSTTVAVEKKHLRSVCSCLASGRESRNQGKKKERLLLIWVVFPVKGGGPALTGGEPHKPEFEKQNEGSMKLFKRETCGRGAMKRAGERGRVAIRPRRKRKMKVAAVRSSVRRGRNLRTANKVWVWRKEGVGGEEEGGVLMRFRKKGPRRGTWRAKRSKGWGTEEKGREESELGTKRGERAGGVIKCAAWYEARRRQIHRERVIKVNQYKYREQVGKTKVQWLKDQSNGVQ